jgi:hypothetical protein
MTLIRRGRDKIPKIEHNTRMFVFGDKEYIPEQRVFQYISQKKGHAWRVYTNDWYFFVVDTAINNDTQNFILKLRKGDKVCLTYITIFTQWNSIMRFIIDAQPVFREKKL